MHKYFIRPNDKNGSSYYEFYKGKWDEKTFWKEDSICINDNDFYDSEFDNIIIKFSPEYNPFGETEITKSQWNQIKSEAILCGGKASEIAIEADEWVIDTFSKHEVFTILGL